MADEQPTQATTEAAPVTQQAPIHASASADAGQAQQAQKTEEAKGPDYRAELAALTAKLTESEARRKGQDRALTRMQRELAALRQGSPQANALQGVVDAMQADIAASVDPNAPESATSKAKAQAKSTSAQAAFMDRRARVMDEIANILDGVVEPLPNDDLPVTADTEDIADAVENGEYSLAKRLAKELKERKTKPMTTQPEKTQPAAKTYTDQDIEKAKAQARKEARDEYRKEQLNGGALETTPSNASGGTNSPVDRFRRGDLKPDDVKNLTPEQQQDLAKRILAGEV